MNTLSETLLNELDLNYELIKYLYQIENYTGKMIGDLLNVSKSTIERYLKYRGIKKLFKDYCWLKEHLIDLKLSCVDASKIINCSSSSISRNAFKFGLIDSIPKRQLNVNEDFFSEYNHQSCYWAGFIMADGHLAKEHRRDSNSYLEYLSINLAIKDIDHLKKLNAELTRDDIIRIYTTKCNEKEHTMCNLKLSRKKICEDLNNNFDIPYNNKSLNECISDKIPKEFLNDFMRGYFDGDGCISVKKSIQITVIGGQELCVSFKRILDKEYNQDIGRISQDNTNKSIYLFNACNKKDIILIYLFLYNKKSICLKRKLDNFKIFLQKI